MYMKKWKKAQVVLAQLVKMNTSITTTTTTMITMTTTIMNHADYYSYDYL